jgi:hypothetical protein
MQMINSGRLFQLIKIHFYLNRKNAYITLGIVMFLLFLMPVAMLVNASAYGFLLYFFGFIVTGRAFTEIHDSKKAFHYLTLPCTNMERFLSKFLSTAVIFPLFLVAVFYVASLLHGCYGFLFYREAFPLFNLMQAPLWIGIGKYIVFQSLFLLGAAYFDSNSIAKTTLVLCFLSLLLAIALVLFSQLICPLCEKVEVVNVLLQSAYGLRFVGWVVVAPFCWFGTYWLIAHREIK